MLHPRYPVIPKFGMNLAPKLLYWAMRPVLEEIIASGYDFDLIDAHYYYPDGVAAAMLARHLKKPVVITARGSDINLIARWPGPRRKILWAANDVASASIGVAQALADELLRLGVEQERVRVLRNGVDLERFRPLDREVLRQRYEASFPVLLSVGHLIPRKGHDIVVEALAELPNARLFIVGDGPERQSLESLVRQHDLTARVCFFGALPYDEVAKVMNAADILVLASDREGWANVLLEAMACGTPVVATNVWGTPEVVASPEAGRLVEDRSPAAVAACVRSLLKDMPDRRATRAYAERFSWEETTEGQLALFREVIEEFENPG